MKGDWPLKPKLPYVGGHEGAGIVVAKGSDVKEIEIGDYAGIKWLNGSCLMCDFCMGGDEPLCQKALISGCMVDGSFQQYAVAKAAHVARIPKDCDLAAIAPLMCAGVTVYKGLKESNTRPGQWVAIVGAGGGLGTLAIQLAKAMGLHTIAIDSGAGKEEHCKTLGAEVFIDFRTSKDLVSQVRAACPDGLGPHAALVLAVQELPFQQATEYVRPRGVVVCIELPAGAYIKASVFDLVVRMISIKGSYVGSRLDALEVIDFFRAGLVKAPYHVVPLSQLPEIFKSMETLEIVGRYVVDTSS
jgi:propanol-preferring alcohol dehydrogenase